MTSKLINEQFVGAIPDKTDVASSKVAPVPEWFDSDADSLNKSQTIEARKHLVSYPTVVRQNVDCPIGNQSFANISYCLFKEPRKLSTGKNAYGLLKVRGAWPSTDVAVNEASKIIKEVDSKNKIQIVPVGHWVPISEEEAFNRESIDIKTHEDESALRDAVVREKEAEQRKIMREIREREEQLKTEKDIYDDPKSLKYYTMKRVTHLRLFEEHQLIAKKFEEIKKILDTVRSEVKNLDDEFPEYDTEWLEMYNQERSKVSLPKFSLDEEYKLFFSK